MTDSQVVGWHGPDGEVQPLVRAIAVDSGATKAFFQNVAVTNITASLAPVAVAAPATFAGCTLAGRPVRNIALPSSGPARRGLAPAALLVRRADVLLLDSTVDAAFSENEVVVAPPEESAVFAAPQLQVVSGRWEPLEPRAVADAGEELQAMGQAEEFVALQQELAGPPPAGGGGPALSTPALAVVITLAVLLVCAVLCYAAQKWKRSHSAGRSDGVPEELGQTSQTAASTGQKRLTSGPSIASSGIRPTPRSASSSSDSKAAPPATSPQPDSAPHVVHKHLVHFPQSDSFPSAQPLPSVMHRQMDTADVDRGTAQRSEDEPPPPQSHITAAITEQLPALEQQINTAAPTHAPAPPPGGPTVADVLVELQKLPRDCSTGLHGYAWAGDGWRRGGQGVVVILPQRLQGPAPPLGAAAGGAPPQPAEARAMKIFARATAFVEELKVFRNADLNAFMPTMYEFGYLGPQGQHDSGLHSSEEVVRREQELLRSDAEAAAHAVLARPFIVMQKGDSLSDCFQDHIGDPVATLVMLIEVTTCLRQLHACGFVHRDIKPDNLLRVHRPGVAEWKLIDCGLSARAGTAVRPACTVHYAAPEVLAAHTAGAHITAAPAHDAWSLGITIFRLLDSEQARAFFELDQEKVRRGEFGEIALPWTEAGRAQHSMQHGRLTDLLPRLLDCDPERRMSVAEFGDSLVRPVPGHV